LCIDPADIALAGDSAGGTLAIVSAIMARDGGMEQKPSALLLFYPVTDLRGDTASYKSVQDVPITAATLHWFRDHYIAAPEDVRDWRASPLLAPSLNGLPPCFLTSAGHDPLCDEAFDFAERLRIAGNSVHHRHLPGQVHGYLTLGRIVKEAERSIDAAASFLLHLHTRTL
jgi:acetyl esterase